MKENTLDEAIALLKAFKKGLKIEFHACYNTPDGWQDVEEFPWQWDFSEFTYRLKKKRERR